MKQSYDLEWKQKQIKWNRRLLHKIAAPSDTGGLAMTDTSMIVSCIYRWARNDGQEHKIANHQKLVMTQIISSPD